MTRKDRSRKKNNRQAGRAKGMTKTYGRPTPSRKKSTNKRVTGRDRAALCRSICARTDPFCVHANGSKIGDGSTRHTVAFQTRAFASITTDASGHAALFVPAHPNIMYRTAATFTGTTVATWNTNVKIPDYTNLALVYSEFRIVSYGVRLFCEANPTESKGIILMATMDEVPTLPDINGTLFPEYERVSLSGMDASWISRRVGPQSSSWNSFSDTTEFDTTTLFVGLSGCTASTAVLAVEITINYEFIPLQGSAVTHLATPAPAVNPLVETAIQHVAVAEPAAQLVPVQRRSTNFWDLAEKALAGLETYGPMAAALLM